MPAEARPARAPERVRRLLDVVPYLVAHPGTRLSDAARLFGVPEDQLLEDLQILFLTGLPPYGPGDLVEVEIEDDRVWVRMADHFRRPLRLTRAEALSLYLRGTALAASPGVREAPALASALAKLREGLGPETLGRLAERIEAAQAGRGVDVLDALRDAVRDRERLEIEYHAASTGESTVRRVDPEEVFQAMGNWYVVAWDHRSGAERLFRADRVRRVTPTGERFEPRGLAGAGRALYTPSEEDVRVRLLLRPAARWVAEYYATEEEAVREDGALEVVLPTGRLEWLARLLLRLGPDAEVLDPPELRDRVRELAERTLARYRRGRAG
ncbi:MAG TPA: WYL domain-containing protein [Actinomycetota bacterium]|nr:WYL domain-containing protein [Actinomycetota bacterium]